MKPDDLSDSLREPQLEPAEACWTVLQDHGPNDGGWGPCAIVLPWMPGGPRLFVYTGDQAEVIEVLKGLVRALATRTGKPTRLVRYTQREDVFVVGGSS